MRVGPFEYIKADRVVTKNKRSFRLLIYGAYNAFGLIGPEKNGIAVLDEDERAVLCDEIAKGDSLSHISYTFDPQQADQFQQLCDMPWEEFRSFINSHPRSRYAI